MGKVLKGESVSAKQQRGGDRAARNPRCRQCSFRHVPTPITIILSVLMAASSAPLPSAPKRVYCCALRTPDGRSLSRGRVIRLTANPKYSAHLCSSYNSPIETLGAAPCSLELLLVKGGQARGILFEGLNLCIAGSHQCFHLSSIEARSQQPLVEALSGGYVWQDERQCRDCTKGLHRNWHRRGEEQLCAAHYDVERKQGWA